MKKERGITLVALIITIIILVILSAVTIQNTIGEHGLIDMATESAIRTRIAEYKDGLDQIGIVIMTENIHKNLTGREYLEEFKKKVDESELFKDKRSAEIMESEEGETELKLRVVTKEGFVYDVTEKEIKYVGSVGEEGFKPLPEIKEGSIDIALDKNDWTKEIPIHATITVNDVAEEDLSSLIIQYTRDPEAKTEWTTYAQGSEINIETNGVIFARVRNNIGETSKTATQKVGIIDTIAPDQPTNVEATNTTNSIKVTAKAKDGAATTEKPEEESGVAKIIIELKGEIQGKEQTVTETKEVTATGTAEVTVEHTFTGLTQSKNYTITVKAIDKAGNESTIATKTQSTGTVPGGEQLKTGTITFTPDKKTWTKGPVNVTITSTYTDENNGGYKLQYAIKDLTNTAPTDSDWHDYGSGPVEMTTNGTIYARLKDNSNQYGTAATATQRIDIIDTIAPNNPTNVTAVAVEGTDGKKNCIKVEATAQDGDVTTDKPGEQSGIAKIQVKIDSGSWTDVTATSEIGATVTANYTSASQTGGAHTIKVKAIDKAGNESDEVSANNVTIDATPPSQPTITVTDGENIDQEIYTKNITVTITPGEDSGVGATGTNQTTYSITGTAEQSSGTIQGTNKKDIPLTQDGDYIITATTTDNAGNTSTETKATVSLKKTPLDLNITIDEENVKGDTIPIKLEALSGEETVQNVTYTAYLTPEDEEQKPEVSITSDTYTFKDLDEKKDYTIKVVASSKDGRTAEQQVTVKALAIKYQPSYNVFEMVYRRYTDGMTWREWVESKYDHSIDENVLKITTASVTFSYSYGTPSTRRLYRGRWC